MTPETMDMFAGTIQDLADGPRLGGYAEVTEALMRRFAEKRFTLATLAGPKMMNRSLATLKGHAREYKLRFPDYVPDDLKKTAVLMQRGDFYECEGDVAGEVAATLQIVTTKRGGGLMCAVPAHGLDGAKDALRAAHFRVKIVHQKRGRKAAKNG